VGNPPFQDTANRGKTQHKVWIDFTARIFDQVLSFGGNFGWITPTSFSSPSNKVLNLFREHEVKVIDFDTGRYFPTVGSTFSNYTIVKGRNQTNTTMVRRNAREFEVCFDNSTFYLPNDFCDESYSIHKKVMFDNVDRFNVKKDYVSCHNILLNKENSTLSKTKTDKHIYPVFHTNRQKWFTTFKQDFADSKKVMWTRSGYTKPFYDDGTMGCTDMGYYITVQTDEDGINLENNFDTELFRYIFKTAKWSGFGNEKVFSALPEIPIDRKMTDDEMYNFFSISDDEINYIKTFSNKKVLKDKTKKLIKSDTRVKNLGEVFTPKELVNTILDTFPQEEFSSNQLFLDPSCGNGNFLVEVVKRKKNMGIPDDKNASTIYGVDIMEDNVSECRERLLSILGNKYKRVLDNNILCTNGFEYDYSFFDLYSI
tara:strand:- start:18457 stop:19734 length:1278 start_codon:yes stop_codon:yes gene_type:complete